MTRSGKLKVKGLRLKILILILTSNFLFLTLPKMVASERISINSTVDKSKIRIGDRIKYRVVIKHKSDMKVGFPPLDLEKMGEFEVKDIKTKKKTRWGKTKVELGYILSIFSTGEYEIPEFVVGYEDSGEKKEIRTKPLKIMVEGVKPTEKDTGDIRDVKLPVSIGRGIFFYIILILLTILVIMGIVFYYFYRTKKSLNLFEEKIPPKPAHQVAYERLLKLSEAGLIEKGEIKEYYIILSEVIREYIQGNFDISVLDRTTSELYREMRESEKIEKKHATLIRDFLEECDLVKFAKYIPQKEVILEDTDNAKKIIDLTKTIP